MDHDFPPGEREQAAQIADLALRFRALQQDGGDVFDGGPVTARTLRGVSDAVAQGWSARALLDDLAVNNRPDRALHGMFAIIWAQGFNTGALYADRRSTSGAGDGKPGAAGRREVAVPDDAADNRQFIAYLRARLAEIADGEPSPEERQLLGGLKRVLDEYADRVEAGTAPDGLCWALRSLAWARFSDRRDYPAHWRP